MAHAASHLREQFRELLEEFVTASEPEDRVTSLKRLQKLRALTGRLWNCTDQLPGSSFDDVEALVHWLDFRRFKNRGTYGAAAQLIRPVVERELAKLETAIEFREVSVAVASIGAPKPGDVVGKLREQGEAVAAQLRKVREEALKPRLRIKAISRPHS